MSRQYLGEFELLALAAVMRLEDDAYGMRIRQEIETRCGRAVSIGAVYTTLERLEEKGHLRATVGEPTAMRGGRAKRYFRVSASGSRAFRRSLGALRKMVDGLELGVSFT